LQTCTELEPGAAGFARAGGTSPILTRDASVYVGAGNRAIAMNSGRYLCVSQRRRARSPHDAGKELIATSPKSPWPGKNPRAHMHDRPLVRH
jgi:hypothetical protein